jgi:hypothetical protein
MQRGSARRVADAAVAQLRDPRLGRRRRAAAQPALTEVAGWAV